MKKEKTFRAVIIRNLIIGYIAIFLVLFGLLLYERDNAQKSVLASVDTAASLYVDELVRQMEAVESKCISWYAQDGMGGSLERDGNSLKKHLVAFKMKILFDEEMARDENIRMAFVFYDNYQTARYSQASGFNDIRIQAVKKLVQEQVDPEVLTNCWKLFTFGDEVYLVRLFGKNGVVTGEVLDFVKITSRLAGGSDDMDLIYTDIESALTNIDRALELDIPYKGDAGRRISDKETISMRYEILPEKLYLYVNMRNNVSFLKSQGILFVLILLLITGLSAAFCYELFHRHMIRPLETMSSTLDQITGGDTEVRMNPELGLAEYDEFGRHFNEMMDQVRDLKIASYEEKLNKEKVLLQLLKFQLEPHFYLNSLTTIYALSQQKKYDLMENKLLAISDYIRFSFKNAFSPVPLSDELKFAEDTYKLRRDSRNYEIFLHIQAEEELMDYPVLPFCLQTFVENSMKYAVNEEGLHIDIQVSRYETEEEAFLDLVVSDNGQGYPQEWIETLNSEEMDLRFQEEEDKHVGLINLKKRLQIEYGDKATLFLRNSHGAVSEIIYTLEKSL